MKNFLIFISLTIMSLAFVSCDEDIFVNVNGVPTYTVPTYVAPGTTNSLGQSAIAFNGYTNGQLNTNATRAFTNSNSQTGYDDFTFYAWTKDSVVMNKYHVQWVTNGWTYVGVDNQQLKFFDNFVDEYNFIGVIPQTTASIANDNTVTVGVEGFTVDNEATTDTPNEFLYAATTVAKAKYPEGVTMNFKHGNAKVYLCFTSDDANTEILDYTPYTPEVPYQPAVPGTQTTSTKTGKALDMLYAGEIVYWPYADDKNLTSTQANNFYKNTSNYENMGSLMDAVNAQFVYYNTSGSVTTNAWVEGSAKKDMYGIQLAPSTNKDDFIGGATEDTWKDAFWTNASAKIKDIFRPSYAAGWRVIRIEHIAGTQYDAWLLNNTEMTYKVITTTGGTPEVPYQPATGKPGIIMLPATSTLGNGTDAVLATYPSAATVKVSLSGLAWTPTALANSVTYSKPTTKITSNDTSNPIKSPTTWFNLPCNNNNVGYTVKLSYKYKGVNVYDARVFIPSTECQWSEGKYYTYIIQINGRGNGKQEPNNPKADDPTITTSAKNEIKLFKVEFSEYTPVAPIIKEIK